VKKTTIFKKSSFHAHIQPLSGCKYTTIPQNYKKMLFFSLFEMRDFGGKVKALQVDDTIAATHYLMAKMYKAKKEVINAVAQCTLAITDKRVAHRATLSIQTSHTI